MNKFRWICGAVLALMLGLTGCSRLRPKCGDLLSQIQEPGRDRRRHGGHVGAVDVSR